MADLQYFYELLVLTNQYNVLDFFFIQELLVQTNQDSKIHDSEVLFQFFFFFFFLLLQGLVICPRSGDPFVSQNPRGVGVSFSKTDSGLCIYHLFT